MQLERGNLHHVRWYYLRTGRVFRRFDDVRKRLAAGDERADAEHLALLKRYSPSTEKCDTDFYLFNCHRARDQAVAFNPKVARAFSRQRLAFLGYLEGRYGPGRFGAAAVRLRASWEQHATPDAEVIRNCAAEIRSLVDEFESRAPLLGEEEKWTDSNIARLGEQRLHDINREKQYKRERFVSVLQRKVGEAIYWAIGAGAFQGDIPYLYELAVAFDEERIEDAYAQLFTITNCTWSRLLRLGYGGTKGYPGSEFDVVLGNYARETRRLVETTKKIAHLFEEEAEFWENSAGLQSKPDPAPSENGSGGHRNPGSGTRRDPLAKAKAIAGLLEHHGYSDDSISNLESTTPTVLARECDIKSNTTVSNLIKSLWGGQPQYEAACDNASRRDRDREAFVAKLRQLANDYSPAREAYGPDLDGLNL
ncbi:hypothetical protein [Botrimarina mediterranea]|uniref:hypothetical protein n=1 Tax=Botrimarina mediterranea TaxID=2528022 RepID=UPI00119D7B9D|nr:hypothetical protein [Botrimarina mediterranea]